MMNETTLQSTLEQLARQGVLPESALAKARQRVGLIPSRGEWLRFLNTVLLTIGTLLLLAGIIFFFAYNWVDLHRFAKLGLAGGAVAIATGLAHWLGLDRLSGKIALSAAAVLVGALLAVFGQIYQTGADAYMLFVTWAVLVAPWVFMGRFPPLWLGWQALLNVAYFTFTDTIDYRADFPQIELAFLLNAAALGLWDWAEQRLSAGKEREPRYSRIVLLYTTLLITIATIDVILGGELSALRTYLFAPALYIVFVAAVIYVNSRLVKDLLSLTIVAVSMIAVAVTFVGNLLDFDGLFALLFLALLVVGMGTLAVVVLRNLGRRWRSEQMSMQSATDDTEISGEIR